MPDYRPVKRSYYNILNTWIYKQSSDSNGCLGYTGAIRVNIEILDQIKGG